MNNMKNLIFLLATVMTLSLISCGKDDPNSGGGDPVVEEPGVEGNWNLESINYTGNQTVSSASTPDVVTTLVGAGKELDLVFSYNEDGTFSSAGSYVIEVTSTVGGFSQTMNETFQDFLGTGTYEFVDPVLTMTNDEREVMADVTSLTDDSLEYSVWISSSETQFGISTVKILNYTLTFTK